MYFTRERFNQVVNTSTDVAKHRYEVVVYHCPLWHPTPPLERTHGRRWTEWELVKHAHRLFPEHQQPKYPLWGYFNEAEPEWAEREIAAAADHGIDVFMIDWYWHLGEQMLHEQLEQGFLKARNRERIKFAIMWANHDWPNVFPAPESGQPAILIPQRYSDDDLLRLTDYLLEHYLGQPNYWRINGEPVFGIFGVSHIIDFFGVEKLRRALDTMRRRVARAGFPGLHIVANEVWARYGVQLKEAGFDSATSYQPLALLAGRSEELSEFPEDVVRTVTDGRSEYGDGVVRTIQWWSKLAAKASVPYFPDVPVGWDDSPRFGHRAHVYVNRSPDQFERFLMAAKHFVAASHVQPKVVFVSAWNEWTEDHYLLPDVVYGYSYLEAVRRAFER